MDDHPLRVDTRRGGALVTPEDGGDPIIAAFIIILFITLLAMQAWDQHHGKVRFHDDD